MTTAPAAPFDAAAATYDARFSDTPLGRRLRREAWRWLDRAFGPGDHVLELGCGTGVDAVHLARRGVAVTATDDSGRMLDRANERMAVADTNDLVRLARLDLSTVGSPGWATALVDDAGTPFDGAYADFGVIDCVPDRTRLLAGLATVVRPGGRLVLVGMAPLCPWELGWHLLHREPRGAVRRWRSGAPARVDGGASLRVWYPTARRVAREAAPWFTLDRAGGIGVALPPSGLSLAMERRPGLLRMLAPIERHLGPTRLGAWVTDHWAVELRRRD